MPQSNTTSTDAFPDVQYLFIQRPRTNTYAMVAIKKAAKAKTYTIDCSTPVEDNIMDIAAFERFLMDKIKVDGKTGT